MSFGQDTCDVSTDQPYQRLKQENNGRCTKQIPGEKIQPVQNHKGTKPSKYSFRLDFPFHRDTHLTVCLIGVQEARKLRPADLVSGLGSDHQYRFGLYITGGSLTVLVCGLQSLRCCYVGKLVRFRNDIYNYLVYPRIITQHFLELTR